MDEVRISSGGTELVAGFRRNSASAACIVLAHGFGLVWRAGLVHYIERFNQAGYNVLAFDYRHFGGSGGSPRGLVHVSPSTRGLDGRCRLGPVPSRH
jgi:uncharacterized protein